MLKLFRYLKRVRVEALIIVCLLALQASCELTLPQYTSDLVDVGIQQGGIAQAVPQSLREQTMDDLFLFLSEEQEVQVTASYDCSDSGLYLLNTKDKEQLAALEETMAPAMTSLSLLEASSWDADAIRAALDSGTLTGEQLREKSREALDALGPQDGNLAVQRAIPFIRAEYEAQGINLNRLQLNYLFYRGSQMLLVSLVMALAAILVGLLASRAAARVGMDLRGDVFEKVVSFSAAEMDQFSTASLITRSTNDIQQIQTVVVMLLRVVLYAPIIGIGGILKVTYTSTGMGWIIAVAVVGALGVVAVLMSLAMPRFKRIQRLLDRLNLVSREILTGLNVIRAFSREEHEEDRFDKASRDLMRTQLFTNRVMNVMMPAMTLVMGLVSVLIVWNAGHGIDAGTMQVGDLIAFLTYTMQIVMAFLMIAMVSIMLPRAGVAAGRINEVLATQPSIRDPEQPKDDLLSDPRGVISFEDVSFHYPDAKADVLEHISFTARPGETTAIIGSTGSGKSTLLNLIPRFFDVTGGRITLDGVDIRDISQGKLRSVLGYVPQKGILFSGNIESNLKFGGDTISREDMEQAARTAQAWEFISSRPDGYESSIAQGGGNVSGGQKQRLSIARALAKHPKVLLFDDSFSALDYKTDLALRRALHEQAGDAAVIMVAQRVSTILHAQQIIVLDEGRMVGIGTHQELLNTCPTYGEIARSQLSEAELGGEGA